MTNRIPTGEPVITLINGKRRWAWPDGTNCPVISGGAEDGPPAAPPAPATPPAPADPPPPPAYTPPASQADLDRIIGERVARERAKAPTAEELADLRKKAEAHDALAAASQTAEEQAIARATAAEQLAATATANANRTLRRSALIAAAATAKAVDPAIVADLLENSDAVTIDNAGQVTGADTAVTTLLTEKPFLAASDGASGGSSGGSFGAGAGRGGAGDKPKGSLSAGAERFKEKHGKTTTTN